MSDKKKLYIGSNLKMYKGISQSIEYLCSLENLCKAIKDIELFIIPSYTSLDRACNCINQDIVKLGAQNVSWEEEGQFTGEISIKMLREIGIDLVMVGHSERRVIFREDDFDENKKVLTLLEHDFTTLLCVGEMLADKEFNVAKEKISMQLKIALNGVRCIDIRNLRIAYEPAWSIGILGKPASPTYVQAMHRHIKEVLYEIFGKDSINIPVLYGGSVNMDNCIKLIQQKDIDGLFVGRAAWDAKNFFELISKVLEVID